MRDRRPAQLVIERLLTEQDGLQPRSTLARILGFSPLGQYSRSWYQGALGEVEVGRILDSLPSGWATFHALPIGTGDSDVDHLVIGPSGAYAINTKHHRDKRIWVNGSGLLVEGQRTHHITNSEHEATRVTRMLRAAIPNFPAVQPVVVLVAPKQVAMKKRPAVVKVIDSRGLRRWLIKQPAAIDYEDYERLVTYLDDPTVWRAHSGVVQDAHARFFALDREVRIAGVRQTLWKALALIVGIVVAINVLPAIISLL